jgi:thioredoxin reductase/NAD-dependent dihydropyrimidine dehydrogenase PreA subunit
VIDPNKCVGCAACVNACPEMPGHRVLGLLHGKATLISPTDCIGHAACLQACPVDAITLVFGTERRGIDIPHVKPDFQTNVPGIYIAGELGGMGLIRNAIEQGRQAVESLQRAGRADDPGQLDLLIVGAGPAGFSASLAALEKGLRYATIEQETLGGTVAHFPRGKLVMTSPARLPIVGNFRFRETTKERLIEYLTTVERDTGVKINYHERVEAIGRDPSGFVVRTTAGEYRAKQVLLAIGRRGTPRKLEVPGEELPKVAYRLIDPEQYIGQHVLVVGGGDSALEAACSIADVADSNVTLSYRSPAFTRAKQKNRERVEAAAAAGRLQIVTQSQVAQIEAEHVELLHAEQALRLPNDAVIISAGGILPSAFLRGIGIEVETKFGTT